LASADDSQLIKAVNPACTAMLSHLMQGQPLLWVAQHVLNPLQKLVADNCHLTRDPLPLIHSTFAGSLDAVQFSVDGASLIAPHVAGIARRQVASV
jgi:hypothetical protein